MRKTNKIKLGLIAGVLLNFGIVNAQIVQKQPVAGFGGLSYPQPMESSKNEVPGINELMSSQITSGQIANKDNVTEMRKEALREIAGQLGASNGLAYRMRELKIETDVKAAELDKLFDFSKRIIDNGVLAPVLTEGMSNYSQSSDDQVRIADKIYRIEVPAKFVSVYPTWRTYLRFSFPLFDTPDRSFLPQNDTEKAVWDESLKEGWAKGVTQANRIYEASYAKMERDYLGMVKYQILLEEGLITPTIVAKQNLGVTGGGKEMAINDQVFRITDHSALNPNKKDWNVEYPVTNQVNGKLN
jgi:defect-in-organelle-trafficking protein DotC